MIEIILHRVPDLILVTLYTSDLLSKMSTYINVTNCGTNIILRFTVLMLVRLYGL